MGLGVAGLAGAVAFAAGHFGLACSLIWMLMHLDVNGALGDSTCSSQLTETGPPVPATSHAVTFFMEPFLHALAPSWIILLVAWCCCYFFS
jgi:hypothetical protein